jgi:hypothetical protein
MKTIVDREDLIFSPSQLGCVLHLSGLPGGAGKIYDRSPYANHGTITGATWKRLPSGLWYLDYDGADDHVDCGVGASLNITEQITLEAWIKPFEELSSEVYHIVSKRNGWGAGLIPYDLNFNGIDTLRLQIWETNNKTVTQEGITIGAWNYVVGRYDGNSLVTFIQCVPSSPVASTEGLPDSSSIALWVGSAVGHAVEFKGSIALPRVYNRALSALELQNHFEREKHLFGVW